jgi:hypothetical protein
MLLPPGAMLTALRNFATLQGDRLPASCASFGRGAARWWERRENVMIWRRATPLICAAALVGASGAAAAHHSFAMFDQEHLIEIEGVVREFRFIAPHAFIILEVKEEDGRITAWALEGAAPTALVRDGWSIDSLRPSQEIKLVVAPLRSGAPGGWWTTKQINFKDGKPIAP